MTKKELRLTVSNNCQPKNKKPVNIEFTGFFVELLKTLLIKAYSLVDK